MLKLPNVNERAGTLSVTWPSPAFNSDRLSKSASNLGKITLSSLTERDIELGSVACFSNAVNKILVCGVAVISNSSVCDVCVYHAAVFSDMKLIICDAVFSCFTLFRPNFSMKTSLTRAKLQLYSRYVPLKSPGLLCVIKW